LIVSTTGCQNNAVGIADSRIIPDNRFTATSYFDSYQYAPKNARLYMNRKGWSGWAPRTTTDPNDYLQIDLGEVYVICAVATRGSHQWKDWVKQYQISTSIDNNIWSTYMNGKSEKVGI
jgi:hypothetical protein